MQGRVEAAGMSVKQTVPGRMGSPVAGSAAWSTPRRREEFRLRHVARVQRPERRCRRSRTPMAAMFSTSSGRLAPSVKAVIHLAGTARGGRLSDTAATEEPRCDLGRRRGGGPRGGASRSSRAPSRPSRVSGPGWWWGLDASLPRPVSVYPALPALRRGPRTLPCGSIRDWALPACGSAPCAHPTIPAWPPAGSIRDLSVGADDLAALDDRGGGPIGRSFRDRDRGLSACNGPLRHRQPLRLVRPDAEAVRRRVLAAATSLLVVDQGRDNSAFAAFWFASAYDQTGETGTRRRVRDCLCVKQGFWRARRT